jgi:hypothetical protein
MATGYVDVPMSGWRVPSPGEYEVMDGSPDPVPGMELYVADGDHPDWFFCVYASKGGAPVAQAAFRSGQAVALPPRVAKKLIRIARSQAKAGAQ